MTTTQHAEKRAQDSWSVTPSTLIEFSRHTPSGLVDGLLPSQGVITLAGEPGCGKSFVALSWAACIAEGIPWFGITTRQTPVVYVVGEGWAQFGRRVEAWQDKQGHVAGDDLHFVDGGRRGIDMADRASVGVLTGHLRDIGPGLVVLDTFSMLSQVKSENDNAEVAKVFAAAHHIVREVGTSVMFIHHVAKTGGGVRGATAFMGNADTVVMATRDKNAGVFSLSTEARMLGKQRDFSGRTIGGFSIASPGVVVNDKDDCRPEKDAAAVAIPATMTKA